MAQISWGSAVLLPLLQCNFASGGRETYSSLTVVTAPPSEQSSTAVGELQFPDRSHCTHHHPGNQQIVQPNFKQYDWTKLQCWILNDCKLYIQELILMVTFSFWAQFRTVLYPITLLTLLCSELHAQHVDLKLPFHECSKLNKSDNLSRWQAWIPQKCNLHQWL